MKIMIGIEKRDWGSGKRTWREIGPILKRYARHTKGPSEFTTRLLANKQAKIRAAK